MTEDFAAGCVPFKACPPRREDILAAEKDIQEAERAIVDHPAHYNSGEAMCSCGRRIECIDIVRHLDFNIGNAIKYLWRYKHKNGLIDLKKAQWYIADAIKQMENKK